MSKKELIWGDGIGVEKSFPRAKKELKKEKTFVLDNKEKMDQFLKANTTTEDYMEENQFIEGFVPDNDRDLVNNRLSERILFSDGCKNPFMIDSDYSKDIDMASKYIKFGKK